MSTTKRDEINSLSIQVNDDATLTLVQKPTGLDRQVIEIYDIDAFIMRICATDAALAKWLAVRALNKPTGNR